MAPTTPAQTFVNDYIKLLPESDANQFLKVLEMKVAQLFYIFSFDAAFSFLFLTKRTELFLAKLKGEGMCCL